MSTEYSADFLLRIAEGADIPRINNSPWPWHACQSVDGWQVLVFYDAGEFDYIEHFIAPDGSKIGIWEGEETPDNMVLRAWPAD